MSSRSSRKVDESLEVVNIETANQKQMLNPKTKKPAADTSTGYASKLHNDVISQMLAGNMGTSLPPVPDSPSL